MVRRILLIVLLITVALMALLFGWLNPDPVSLDLGFAAFTAPLSFICIGALLLGWLFGLGTGSVWSLRKSRQNRKLRRSLESTQAELDKAKAVAARQTAPLTVADGRG
jgi:uncharacterized integral membrane protein